MIAIKEYIEHPELLDVLELEDLTEEMQEHPASSRIRWLYVLKKQRLEGTPLNDLRLAWMHAPEMTTYHEAFRKGSSDDVFVEINAEDAPADAGKETDSEKQKELVEPSDGEKAQEHTPGTPSSDASSEQSVESKSEEPDKNTNKQSRSLKEFSVHSASSSEHHLMGDTDDSPFLRWLRQKEQDSESTPEAPALGSEPPSSSSEEEPAEKNKSTDKAEKTEDEHIPSPEEKEAMQAAIRESIEQDEDILSPTLAEVLAEQGHIQGAIDMYEKLSLVYPEKSSYFANRIEQLKNR